MNGGNFNIKAKKTRILLAPLDWGLGHATRCVPLIKELLNRDAEVIIAAEGAVQQLLRQEFPQLQFVHLPGYRIRYSRSRRGLIAAMLWQVPRILLSIYREKKWLKKNAALLTIDAVISDNRYGLHHPGIPCIFITHQLQIQTGNAFSDRILQKINYRHINRFRQCWIPDAAGEYNLAGRLSHPEQWPQIPVQYLGPLSRLEKKEAALQYDLCILVSGPEPQRSMFEKMMLEQLETFSGKALLIRGLPGNEEVPVINNPGISIRNHLTADELALALAASELVVCRSGYSTIMDLTCLEKKAVLVPTPGQTEQEYLATSLQEKGLFPSLAQEKFSIPGALDLAKRFPFTVSAFFNNDYRRVIGAWLNDQ